MTVRLGFDTNVEKVVASIEDVKQDIPTELQKRVGAAMRVMLNDARQYVQNDPDWTGDLMTSLSYDSSTTSDGLEFTISTDAELAPYAAIVEFGSGSRTDQPRPGGPSPNGNWRNYAADATTFPPGYPYESPDIDFDQDNPFNTGPYPKFYGFARHIEDWMRSKPVQPERGDYFASAILIAATIIRRGNYAHPFLRPAYWDNELQIRQAARHAVKNATR